MWRLFGNLAIEKLKVPGKPLWSTQKPSESFFVVNSRVRPRHQALFPSDAESVGVAPPILDGDGYESGHRIQRLDIYRWCDQRGLVPDRESKFKLLYVIERLAFMNYFQN